MMGEPKGMGDSVIAGARGTADSLAEVSALSCLAHEKDWGAKVPSNGRKTAET
jgi:hypothetical protein